MNRCYWFTVFVVAFGAIVVAEPPVGTELPTSPTTPGSRTTVRAPNGKVIVSKSAGMKLTLIPAGEFEMGSHQSKEDLVTMFAKWDAKADYFRDEFPRHWVKISRPFYLGTTEVTQAEYQSVMGINPSAFPKAYSAEMRALDTRQFPVENVSWYDVIEYCNKLSVNDGLPAYYRLTVLQRKNDSIRSAEVTALGGRGYRLPTEAEWEYACRGGTTTAYHTGDTIDALGRAGWYRGNSTPEGSIHRRPNRVSQKSANAFGLYDMHGSVSEWCEDVYDMQVYSKRSGTTVDPLQTSGGKMRVLRGGSWYDEPLNTRSACRDSFTPIMGLGNYIGFRVARTP